MAIGLSKDVREWSKQCVSLAKKKGRDPIRKVPLKSLPVLEVTFTFDIVGPLPRSKSGYS